jgi:predicted DNA-binding transcriptional regulator AlpA
VSATSIQEILSEREVSNWLGISEPTLFRHRRNGTGPRFIRLSARRIAYRRSAVEEWLRGCERQTLTSLPSAETPEGSSPGGDLLTGLASDDGLATSGR